MEIVEFQDDSRMSCYCESELYRGVSVGKILVWLIKGGVP